MAATISVRYFDESGSKRVPPRVSKALVFGRDPLRARRQAGARPDDHGLRVLVELGERPRLHDAVRGSIGLLRRARGGREAGVGRPAIPSFPSKPATLGGEQPGASRSRRTCTPCSAASPWPRSERRCGWSSRTARRLRCPMHGRWFAYAVAGTHTQPGHRPTELRFLRDGKLVRRSTLSPVSFNTLAEARALVPRSDGSTVQNAIRGQLLDEIEGRVGDGGLFASHVRLSETRLVTSLSLGHGLKVSVYAAPVTPFPSSGGAASALVAAVGAHSGRPIFMATSEAGFPGAEGGVVLPGHPEARLTIMTGSHARARSAGQRPDHRRPGDPRRPVRSRSRLGVARTSGSRPSAGRDHRPGRLGRRRAAATAQAVTFASTPMPSISISTRWPDSRV